MMTTLVPCGKCNVCKWKKICNWKFRLKQEYKRSSSAYFVTLTYSEENLTYADSGATLVKDDLQRFFKRLRKEQPDIKLKYFAVGEYGKRFGRPHYHILLFNLDPTKSYTELVKGRVCYKHKSIDKAWKLGLTDVPPLNMESKGVAYVMKYISKDKTLTQGKQPEFALISKGIGSNYLTDSKIEYHKRSEKHSYVIDDGYKMPMPKYFKEKIYTPEERAKLTQHLLKVSEEIIAKSLQKELYLVKDEQIAIKNLFLRQNVVISKPYSTQLDDVL